MILKTMNRWVSCISVVMGLYFPLIFLGPGSDNDSHRVIATAIQAIKTLSYTPSRNPGFFIHELATTILYKFGGIPLANFGTWIASCLALVAVYRIGVKLQIHYALPIVLLTALHPIFGVNSTCIIDYNWALCFLLWGVWAYLSGRHGLMSLMLGLAIGTRLTSFFIIPCLIIAEWTVKSDQSVKKTGYLLLGLGLGGLFYIPSFFHANRTLSFLQAGGGHEGAWSWMAILARVVYKNIYFWGFFGFIFIVWGLLSLVKNYKQIKKLSALQLKFITAATGFVLILQISFVRYPFEMEYFLPILPFILLIFFMIIPHQKQLLWGLGLCLLSYHFVSLNIAKPDKANAASTATLGFFVEDGYMISDIKNRKTTLHLKHLDPFER